jgi:hypothetical protein
MPIHRENLATSRLSNTNWPLDASIGNFEICGEGLEQSCKVEISACATWATSSSRRSFWVAIESLYRKFTPRLYLGPILIFDKSLFQSLNVDQAAWVDNIFLTVITPLLFVETLANLEKIRPEKQQSPRSCFRKRLSRGAVG